MERIKRYLRSAAGYQAVCAKWLVLAALVGCVVGPLGGAFGLALNWANATRGAHPVAALSAAHCRSCYRIFVSPL